MGPEPLLPHCPLYPDSVLDHRNSYSSSRNIDILRCDIMSTLTFSDLLSYAH